MNHQLAKKTIRTIKPVPITMDDVCDIATAADADAAIVFYCLLVYIMMVIASCIQCINYSTLARMSARFTSNQTDNKRVGGALIGFVRLHHDQCICSVLINKCPTPKH